MAMAQRRPVARAIASYLLVGGSLASCGLADDFASCSDSELSKTDRVAEQVWQALDSSKPSDRAYCDSSPYPYASGSMDGPASELVERATRELGCGVTSVEGFDSDDADILACDFDGDPYLLEVSRELDRFGPPGLAVGLYKR
jgi:hypothetical protein